MPNDKNIHPPLKCEDGLTFNFIRDVPAETDSFGSHGRLATAVAEVIAQNADLKVIGLLGPWGAGKSTVVRLVQKKLEQAKNVCTHCFSYDAWLHQNDPPRRAFLETLIHFLVQEKLTTLEVWQHQLDQLNRQVEESETTSTPTLTSSGTFITISLLLWPLGFSFVGHEWYTAALKPKAPFSDIWPFAVGTLLVFLPLLTLIGVYLFWRPIKWPFTRGFFKRNNFSTHKPPYQDDRLLSIFINKEVQRQRNRVTRAPDPTTIEFQNIFREIMEAVKGKDRRFLFVIDNLDRLPEADAVAMWGTIRSFFLGAHETRQVRKAADMPTVILPIDEEAIRRMYSVSHSADDVDGLAKSFIDKTFDLTFRVTRPVLSDWDSFLSIQMKKVFGPAMPLLWPYITGRLYERYFVGQHEPNVTPRTINSLINAIAALWLQWKDSDVSFASVAYYSIFRQHIDKNILHAVTNPAAVITHFDPDWQRGIAALHYGALPADAAQILIEQPIRNAILAKDRENLELLRDMPSFDRVLLRVFDQFVVDGIDVVTVLGAAVILENLGKKEDLWYIEGWHRLLYALSLTSQWRAFGSEEADGVIALARHCEASELDTFLNSLNKKLGIINLDTVAVSSFTKPFVSAWSATLATVQAAQLSLPRVQVPGDADAFLAVAAECHDNTLLLKQLMTNVEDNALLYHVSLTLMNPQAAITAESMFRALYSLERSFSWNELASNAIAMVRDQNSAHAGMSAALLILGKLQASEKSVRDLLQTLITGGQVATRLNEAYAQQLDVVISRCLAILLLDGARNFAIPVNGNWIQTFSQRPTLARLISESFIEFGEPDHFQLLIDAATNHPPLRIIVRTIASMLVENGTLGALYIEPILLNLSGYLDCIDDPLHETFIIELAAYDTFWGELQKQPSEGATLTILQILIKQPDELGEKAKSSVAQRLNAVETEAWAASIRTPGKLVEIAADLVTVTMSKKVEIGSHLFDALQGLIDEILQTSSGDLRSNWFNSATYLNASAFETLLRNLRDAILGGQTVTQLADLLTIGGSKVTELGGFNEKADDCARHVILQLVADDAGLEWLAKNSAVAGEWISAAKTSTKKFLRTRLEELRAVDNASQKDRLQILSETWFPTSKSA